MQLDWPTHLDRTDPDDRRSTTKYSVTIKTAIDDINKQFSILDVDDWRLETGLDHRSDKPNYPYANQPEPGDPGAVLRWRMDEGQYAVACDHYDSARDNIRAIGLYIEEKRKMESRPIVTGQSEFATARLPPGDEESEAVAASAPPHEILSIAPDSSPEIIRAAARARKKETHPDNGGSRAEFQRVKEAEQALLDQ